VTILDHTGAAALQRSAIVNLLAEAWENDEVVAEKDILALGGKYPEERFKEVKRRYTLGVEVRDGERFYSLSGPVESGVERADSMGGEEERPSLAVGSLDTQPQTLFGDEPAPHWRDAA
jgi:hypothetical protein